MELNITKFFREAAPVDYSASIAEIGNDAARSTWRAACDDSDEYPLLDSDEKRLGDKRKPEPAQHIIEFPGGAIEVSRLDDGSYWAHIILNRSQAVDDCKGLQACTSEVIDSRIDYEWPTDPCVVPIPHADALHQIAVRIRPTKGEQ